MEFKANALGEAGTADGPPDITLGGPDIDIGPEAQADAVLAKAYPAAVAYEQSRLGMEDPMTHQPRRVLLA
ncbi:MAG TPA: hypothetical protein VGS08_04825 [Candidatus Saccharimonadales bacterium]|nr:hypothetical protein [Candidatus Saccharimonadales bacterium]